MALVKTGSGISSITGSVGGNTFVTRSGYTFLRRRALCIGNPATLGQALTRAWMCEFMTRWGTLTPAQQNLWNEYAKQSRPKTHGVDTQKKGGSGSRAIITKGVGVMSGYNSYTQTNAVLRSAGHSHYVDDAPKNVSSPVSTSIRQVSYIHPLKKYHVYWRVCGVPFPPASRVRMWVRDGRKKYIIGTKSAKSGFMWLNGLVHNGRAHFFLQMDIVSKYGLISTPSAVWEETRR